MPDEYWERVSPWLPIVGIRGGILKASDEDVKFLARAARAGAAEATDPLEVVARWVETYQDQHGRRHAWGPVAQWP